MALSAELEAPGAADDPAVLVGALARDRQRVRDRLAAIVGRVDVRRSALPRVARSLRRTIDHD